MKAMITFMVFLFSAAVFAQDVHFSKEELLGIIGPATQEAACAENIIDCLGITRSTCESEVATLVAGKCASHVPAAGSGGDAVGDVSGKVAGCVMKDIMAKHQQGMSKNFKTAACQSLME